MLLALPRRALSLAVIGSPHRCYTDAAATPQGTDAAVLEPPAKDSSRSSKRKRRSLQQKQRQKSENVEAQNAEQQSEVPALPSSSLLSPVPSSSKATLPAAVPPAVHAVAALHRQRLHEEMMASLEGTGGSHASLEQIERRRSKPSVVEAEFDGGMTERLVPELPRLAALHEVHYGDAVVKEVDRSSFLAGLTTTATTPESSKAAAMEGADAVAGSTPLPKSQEVSLDDDFSDDAFAAFDAETTREAGGASQKIVEGASDGVAVPVVDDGEVEWEEEEKLLHHGTDRPWFVPASGVIQLEPLPPTDCALLLRFLLHLRQQTTNDLPATLQRSLVAAEATDSASASTPAVQPLTFAAVMTYLDVAPAPVLGFSESTGWSSSAASPAASPPSPSPPPPSQYPAWIFHLYIENTSTQNAVGHLAALFRIPQRSFCTRTSASKLACTTTLCAVAGGRLRREHLLLINTMRHPGFVLRVSNIQAVDDTTAEAAEVATRETTPTASLFGTLSRWQPLYEVELLLRRVECPTQQALQHRLRTLQSVGAICFCANREGSLARAAVHCLNGSPRLSILEALYRPKAPLEMTRFLSRPSAETARPALRVSADATIRHVLKCLVRVNFDYAAVMAQVPYAWRRRWMNALRSLVWNTMASKRVRCLGRHVCIGDVVLRPAYRRDVHRRGLLTVKAEHVMVVTTAAEAAAASMDDIFLPFLRGSYPPHLFADDATQHPVMTRESMLSLLRTIGAPHLLLGMSPACATMLDARHATAPMLFRRLLTRPMAFQFAILEDKPPMASTHFDAARLLRCDRWRVADADVALTRQAANRPPSHSGSLIPSSEVLERTTLGARLSTGLLAEEFFDIPDASQYAVLGRVNRQLGDEFVPAAPHTSPADVGDRVYTVYIRAVVENSVAGLNNMLREYLQLSGIETEEQSVLQHKVHRMRRELDRETPLLTAKSFCTACYNRDHDSSHLCAEYQLKRGRRVAEQSRAAAIAFIAPSAVPPFAAEQGSMSSLPPVEKVLMRLNLHRRNTEQRWGVHLTKQLGLVGLEDPAVLAGGAVWCPPPSCQPEHASSPHLDTGVSIPATEEVSAWPASISTACNAALQQPGDNDRAATPVPPLVVFLRRLLASTEAHDDLSRDTERRPTGLSCSPIVTLPASSPLFRIPAAAPQGDDEVLRRCRWTLRAVNYTPVSTRRGVAAALLTEARARDVCLTFECSSSAVALAEGSAGTAGKSPDGEAAAPLPSSQGQQQQQKTVVNYDRVAYPSTISTASMSPERRHKVLLSMQRAVQGASRETQEWLRLLPHNLTIVLTKHRRHLRKSRSWGIQLDTRDMTLVNFAPLMMQYLYASNSAEKLLEVDRAYVSAMSPQEQFQRNCPDLTMHLFNDVLPHLEPVLNDAYRLTRLNEKVVRSKTEAAAAMAAIQGEIDSAAEVEATSMSMSADVINSAADLHRVATASSPYDPVNYFTISLTLERKGVSYRLCSAADVKKVRTPADDTAAPAATPVVEAPPLVAIDEELLQCSQNNNTAVHPLSEAQHLGYEAIIAVSRLLLTDQTRGRWGLRLQSGTTRLKGIHQGPSFTFHVFGAKKAQATRIGDALRLIAPSPLQAGETESGVRKAAMQSFHLYFIERVNHEAICGYQALRAALKRAAEPPASTAETAAANEASQHHNTMANAALPPESVTIGIRQYPLLRVAATVRRGGVGEASALSPVGLHVGKDMRVVAITADSPMAIAVLAAAGPACSLRRLIRSDLAASPTSLDEDVALSSLRTAWDRVRQHCSATTTSSSSTTSRPLQWKYELDEDAEVDIDAIAEASSAVDSSSPASPEPWLQLQEAAEKTLQQLSWCSMVDGAHVMQAVLLKEYAAARLVASAGGPPSPAADLDIQTISKALKEVNGSVSWRVVYAARSRQTLRSPADLASAFAPGVAEETIFLQQVFEE